MPITSLGGQQLAGPVSGYLCQICAEAVAHVGSIGPSALEWALVAHLAPEGIGKLDYGQLRVHGLIGWGGLASRARLADPANPFGTAVEPNSRPFGHLPDLAALREHSDGGWADLTSLPARLPMGSSHQV